MSTPCRTEVAAWLLLLGSGCQPDLRSQPRPHPLGTSPLFANRMEARQQPLGTRAYDRGGEAASRGALPITAALLRRGEVGYQTFCVPCHGFSGAGDGMVVRHGFPAPPPLAAARLTGASDDYLFGVMSQGAGDMPGYAGQVAEDERWAIVAYLRALQRASSGQAPQPTEAR